MKTHHTYVAFLRGINVGGKMINMTDLRQLFENLGFTHVQTFLASGNISFTTTLQDKNVLKQILEQAIETEYGFPVVILLRTKEEIVDLVAANPFQYISQTPQTRFYVTFFAEKPSAPPFSIPYESPEKDFRMVRLTEREVCCSLELSETKNTTDLMAVVEKEFGKHVTTRTWNTLQKIAASLSYE